MKYYINKSALLEEFGHLDYSPRSLKDDGFVMTSMKNRQHPQPDNTPFGPQWSAPAKIAGQNIPEPKHPLDHSETIHNTQNHLSSLGH